MHICCGYINVNRTITREDRNNYFYPLGILYISSSLKKEGHETEILLFHNATQEDMYSKIKSTDKLVLLSIISERDYDIAKEIIKEIKGRYPKIKVGVGGSYPTLVPEDMIANEDIDMVCIGEGEIADVEYARQVEEGKYKKTDNLWIRDNDGTIIKCDRSVVIEDIDSLPYPDRDGWFESYIKPRNLDFDKHNVLLQRGCFNKCIYCVHHILSNKIEGKYVRYRNIDKVIEELEYINLKYDFDYVILVGDSALSDLDYFKELCQKLIKFNEKREKEHKCKIKFICSLNLPTNLLKEKAYIADSIKKANMYIYMGFESVSIEVRKFLNRPYYTNEQFIDFCKVLRKKDIKLTVYIMYNPCFDTSKIYKETIKCLMKARIEYVIVSWISAYKGTILHERYRDKIISYNKSKFIDRFRYNTLKYRVYYLSKIYSKIYKVTDFLERIFRSCKKFFLGKQ